MVASTWLVPAARSSAHGATPMTPLVSAACSPMAALHLVVHHHAGAAHLRENMMQSHKSLSRYCRQRERNWLLGLQDG